MFDLIGEVEQQHRIQGRGYTCLLCEFRAVFPNGFNSRPTQENVCLPETSENTATVYCDATCCEFINLLFELLHKNVSLSNG